MFAGKQADPWVWALQEPVDDNSRLAEMAGIVDERAPKQDRPRVPGTEHLDQLQNDAQVYQGF